MAREQQASAAAPFSAKKCRVCSAVVDDEINRGPDLRAESMDLDEILRWERRKLPINFAKSALSSRSGQQVKHEAQVRRNAALAAKEATAARKHASSFGARPKTAGSTVPRSRPNVRKRHVISWPERPPQVRSHPRDLHVQARWASRQPSGRHRDGRRAPGRSAGRAGTRGRGKTKTR